MLPVHSALFCQRSVPNVQDFSGVHGNASCCTLLQASYEGHADWVNDMAVCEDMLFTCSNDKTVLVWESRAQGEPIANLLCLCLGTIVLGSTSTNTSTNTTAKSVLPCTYLSTLAFLWPRPGFFSVETE